MFILFQSLNLKISFLTLKNFQKTYQITLSIVVIILALITNFDKILSLYYDDKIVKNLTLYVDNKGKMNWYMEI
jgi:hypothetical protein